MTRVLIVEDSMYRHRLTMAGIIAAIAGVAAQNPGADTSGVTPEMIHATWNSAYSRTPNDYRGKPSGAARAKRIARKRRNIRARSAK